jgi:hypothetical protein
MDKVGNIMYRNDNILRKYIGNAGEGLFKTAYDCRIERFSWEPLSVNHLFSAEEVLIVPLDRLTDRQASCISRISIPPNIISSVSTDEDITSNVQKLAESVPLKDWE